MKKLHFIFAVLVFLTASCKERTEGPAPADWVNPFIGASTNTEAAGAYHGLGKTFPGATTPYGLVQVSPNTITGGDNGSGYSYEHTTIEGFAMTQMSGVGWFGDLGNFLVMPTTGPLQTVAGREGGRPGWRSGYDKETETAAAGYYAATLSDYGIRAEASATPRCGILRFTFPENAQSRIQVDLARRVGGTSTAQAVRVLNDSTFCGWMRCTPDGGGWGDGEGKADYTVWFYAVLSRPMTGWGGWVADIPAGWSRHKDDVVSDAYLDRVAQAEIVRDFLYLEGAHLGFFTEFPTQAGESVELKVGISFTGAEGAEKNYRAEMEGKDFDRVRTEARALWNDALGKVRVEGGTEDERTIFYTALYHTMIDPRCYEDVDGAYTGGDGQVHHSGDAFTKRTIFSGWDVFRSQFPLQTLIHPQLVDDLLNSLITLADESGKGYFERWEFLNAYSGCMLGNPALPVLADAWTKGIRGYDGRKALEYAIRSSETTGNGPEGYTPGSLSISYTLEYAYADWCLARLAEALGEQETAARFDEKAGYWKNLFDPEMGWFRPRKKDGSWAPWPEEGRLKEWYGAIECNPFQQGWFVPHDIDGLAEILGGREAAIAQLDTLFENTPEDMLWNVYYNHANEPVHFVPFLYNRLGAPWKTQYWTRFICRHAYENRVEGLKGNEDVGQMSAWYVLAAAGLHPACPGEPVFEITTPVFDKVEIALDPKYHAGKTLTVIAHGNAPGADYIQSARWNGKPWTSCRIDYATLTAGGTLELFLGPEPARDWGI